MDGTDTWKAVNNGDVIEDEELTAQAVAEAETQANAKAGDEDKDKGKSDPWIMSFEPIGYREGGWRYMGSSDVWSS